MKFDVKANKLAEKIMKARIAAPATNLLSIIDATCAVTFYLWVSGAIQIVATQSTHQRFARQATKLGRIGGIVSLILLAICAVPVATAHDAGTFTILVKENNISPNNPQLVFNDSAWWYNVDNSSNLTHRIVWDSDGDGLYNGSTDWDSGNLSAYCETAENGSKLDENCNVTFEIPFNGTWGAGVYEYQDLMSNGTVHNGTITVFSDSHTDAGQPPSGGYEFGGDDEIQEPTTGYEVGEGGRNWLLYVAGASGLLSLLLVGLLVVMGPGKDALSPDDEMNEQNGIGATKMDADIDQIAEEE